MQVIKRHFRIVVPGLLLIIGVVIGTWRYLPARSSHHAPFAADPNLRDAVVSPGTMLGAAAWFRPPAALNGRISPFPPPMRTIPATAIRKDILKIAPVQRKTKTAPQAAPVVSPKTIQAVVAPAAPAAPAPSRIAVAAAVRGTVQAFQGSRGEGRALKSGAPIFLGDKIVTGGQGSLQVMLLDETAVALGPDGSLTLEAFAFNPATDDGKVALRIDQGAFRFSTGRIAHKKPENMTVKFPDAVLDVHGTLVAGHVGGGGVFAVLLGPGPNKYGERVGAFTLRNSAGESPVTHPGFGSRAGIPGRPPTPEFHLSPAQLNALPSNLQPQGGQNPNPNPGTPLQRIVSVLRNLLQNASDDNAKNSDIEKVSQEEAARRAELAAAKAKADAQALSEAQAAKTEAHAKAASADAAAQEARAAANDAQNTLTNAQTAWTDAQTALSGAQTTYNSAQTALSGAQTNFDDAQKALTAVQAGLAGAQTTLAAAQAAFDDAQGKLTAAQTALAAAQTTLTGAQTAANQAQTTLTGAQTAANQAQTALTGAQTAANQAQATLAGAQTTYNSAQTAFSNAQAALAGAQTTYNSKQATLTGAQGTLANLNAAIAAEAAAAAAEAQAQAAYDSCKPRHCHNGEEQARNDAKAAHKATIKPAADAEKAKPAAVTAVNTAQTAVTSAQTALNGAQTTLNGAQTTLAGAQTTLTGAQTASNQAQTTLTGAQTASNQAQTTLAGAQTASNQAQTTLTGAQTTLTGAQTAADDAQTTLTGAQTAANDALAQEAAAEGAAALAAAKVQADEQAVADAQAAQAAAEAKAAEAKALADAALAQAGSATQASADAQANAGKAEAQAKAAQDTVALMTENLADAELGTPIGLDAMTRLLKDISSWAMVRTIERGTGYYAGAGDFKLTKCDGANCVNPKGAFNFKLNVDFGAKTYGGGDSGAAFLASADNLRKGSVSDALAIRAASFAALDGNALIKERSASGNFAADIALKSVAGVPAAAADAAVRYFDGATDGAGTATAPLVRKN